MCRSKKTISKNRNDKNAFTLAEIIAALVILAFLSATVLTVINRCMASAADSVLRMHALEVARDNIESLRAGESVEVIAEYGQSDKYPDIEWKTTVEPFPEPVTGKMWVMAVCSAEYTDSTGQNQKIELTHWLTDLTEKQSQLLLQQQEEERQEKEQQPDESDLPEEEPPDFDINELPDDLEGLLGPLIGN